eukprot:TRINITY_DN798_c1_g1_i1.p1 TRINITY_DN798_c1_g1~~TRINITY_DN798_c1_g1_i1.p1  ORF type:complete len:223 (-),score=87.06 TRINITY_DN798_c1_g1_i1:57-725(-)
MATQESKNNVMQIVKRRVVNLNYLKRTHRGEIHWLNSIHISKDDIKKSVSDTKILQKRIDEWFCLGFNLGELLFLSADDFICSVQQLWDEYLHWTNCDKNKYWSSKMNQFNKEGWFKSCAMERFTPITTGANCDYFEVVCGLCDILAEVYERFGQLTPSQQNIAQSTIQKMDSFVKQHFMDIIIQELNTIALNSIKTRLISVEKIAESNTELIDRTLFGGAK